MVVKNAPALRAARDFVRAVEQSGIRLQAAYLFGSYAKGTAHADSDIDVALVSPDFSGWVDDLEKIRSAVLSRDIRIEMVRFRPDTFRDENPLAWEVKTTGIPLIGNGKRRVIKRKPRQRTKRK
jgi:predicted nucleotidyltransferase